MNITLKPTEKIKKIIRSKENYQWLIDEIVKEVEQKNIYPQWSYAYGESEMGPDAFHDDYFIHLTPSECEEIMIAINQDESAHGWMLEFTCFVCSDKGVDIEVHCPHPVPLPCPECGKPVDFSDLYLQYEFYHEVYIGKVILDDVIKVLSKVILEDAWNEFKKLQKRKKRRS